MKIVILICTLAFGLSLFSLSLFYRFSQYNAKKLKPLLPASGYWLPECKCLKHQTTDTNKRMMTQLRDGESICSPEATYLGTGQKVVSYSLFLNSTKDIKEFAQGLEPNLRKIQKLYPGWYLRLYSNVDIQTKKHHFCDLACKNDQLVWCNVNKIPKYGNLRKMNGRMWRFLPFGDPTVKIFLSRDLDTDISQRERDAVAEWEDSKSIFHMMRDVKVGHDTPMLAGMFGVKNYRLTPWESGKLREEIIKFGKQSHWKGQDQWTLRRLIYKTAFVTEMLTHDSYTCEQYPGTVPFPTKREGHTHVGDSLRKKGKFYQRPLKHCPLVCRPKYGQKWNYC